MSKTEEYFQSITDPQAKEFLVTVQKIIRAVCPNITESFSYNMPAYSFNNKTVWLGVFKQHIGIYPVSDQELNTCQLIDYKGKNTKGTMQLKYKMEVPMDNLFQLFKLKFG